MSQRALGQQFGTLFHGTSHDIGDTVLPRDNTDVEYRGGWEQPGTSSRAHATTREWIAWDFARLSSVKRARKESNAKGEPVVPERTRIYEVEPASDTRIGVEHKDHPDYGRSGAIDSEEHISDIGFKVKHRIDIAQPVGPERWRHGTFPQINWAEHGQSIPGDPDRYNHPSQRETEHGSLQAANEHERNAWAEAAAQRVEDRKAKKRKGPARLKPLPEDPNQGVLFSDRRYRRVTPKSVP